MPRCTVALTETTQPTVPVHVLSCRQLPAGSPARFSWIVDDIAIALQISVRHLKNIRDEDVTFPAPRMLGTVPRWAAASIAQWLAGDLTQPTTGADEDAPAEAVPAPAGATRRRKPPAGRPAAKAAARSASSTGPVWHV